jgi:hypothetical protein
MRLHRKVWLWWGRWWAVQYLDTRDEVSLGFRFNWRHWLLDFYFGPLTIAFGKHPEITDLSEAQRRCCRGFLIGDRKVL